MAKNKRGDGETASADVVGDGAASETAAATAPASDKRHIMITRPDTGESVKRVDYIRHLATPVEGGGKGWSRGEITKHIREVTGDTNFRYQIVFQATKGIVGVKKSERAKPPEATSGEGAAASGGEATTS